MKIFVTGTRGVPDIPGGVEQHCQMLYPLIAQSNHEVHISRRTPYITDRRDQWNGIVLHNIYAPKSKALEAIIHTFLSVLKARQLKVDVVHIHAVGPALLVPFARLLGLKVVFTDHGPDYDRQKWGRFAKSILMLGEYLGGKYASANIVISNVIRQILLQRCNAESRIIYNGVAVNEPSTDSSYLEKLGITTDDYILAVARFVPEKGLHDLIAAYAATDTPMKLVLAGDADHEDDYSLSLKQKARENGVVLTGYITGDELHQIYSHARLFVLPSYHEGLPIALLEALSYGLNVLVSDIPANLEVDLDRSHYFKCGDIPDLTDRLGYHLASTVDEAYYQQIRKLLYEKYNWSKIALETIDVYKSLE